MTKEERIERFGTISKQPAIDLKNFIIRTAGQTGRREVHSDFWDGLVQYTSVGSAGTLVDVNCFFDAEILVNVDIDEKLCIGRFKELNAVGMLGNAQIAMTPGTLYTSAGVDRSTVVKIAKMSRVSGQLMILDPGYYAQYLELRHPNVQIDPVYMMARLQGCRYFPELETVLEQLLRYDGKNARELFYESKFNEIMSWLIYYGDCLEKSENGGVSREDRMAIYRATTYLDEHLREDPSMDELAKIATMSASKFKVTFKRVAGCTLIEYKQQHRLHLAKKLLAETDHPLSAVAAAVGYKKTDNFNAFFAKQMHMSPREFRKVSRG